MRFIPYIRDLFRTEDEKSQHREDCKQNLKTAIHSIREELLDQPATKDLYDAMKDLDDFEKEIFPDEIR